MGSQRGTHSRAHHRALKRKQRRERRQRERDEAQQRQAQAILGPDPADPLTGPAEVTGTWT